MEFAKVLGPVLSNIFTGAIMLTAIICMLFAFARFENSHAEDEPVCMSRYDYEHKVLRSIVTMEIGQETLNSRIEDLRKDMEEDREHHKDEILQLQQTINEKEKEIQSLVSRVSEVATNTTVCMGKCTKEDEDLFTYKDLLAQSTCRAIKSGGNHVYAIRRTCSGSYTDCTGVCRNVGKTCFNSLHVYDAKAMTAEVGQVGLRMYRYEHCGGGCGPNYCCCSGP